jgi:hypothetical protein
MGNGKMNNKLLTQNHIAKKNKRCTYTDLVAERILDSCAKLTVHAASRVFISCPQFP